MRNKKAKALRKIAKQAVDVATKYIVGKPPQFTPQYDDSGMLLGFRKSNDGVPTKLGHCTRDVYKALKYTTP